MLTFFLTKSLYLLGSYRRCRHLKISVYRSTTFVARVMCKTTSCPIARHFFSCFTLQVIVILELCLNQPHEGPGIDLGARRVLARDEFYAPNKKQIYATRHATQHPRIKRS
jgi:hypothetical protein